MTQGSINKIKKTLDIIIMLLMIFLIAYQVTGEVLHEWLGIGLTVLVLVHQILNRKWYQAFFKGRYNPYRVITTVVDIILLASFFFTAFCGMSMSTHAVPFLNGMVPVMFAKQMHLSMSFWSFILMGLHLGLHIPLIAAGLKSCPKIKTAATIIFAVISCMGLYLFLKNNIPQYIFFRTHFAILDYEKAAVLVLLENLTMLMFFAFIGDQAANLLRRNGNTDKNKQNK